MTRRKGLIVKSHIGMNMTARQNLGLKCLNSYTEKLSFCRNRLIGTESRGRVVNTTASYYGGLGFKPRLGGRLS
jgi:hypothetical protein